MSFLAWQGESVETTKKIVASVLCALSLSGTVQPYGVAAFHDPLAVHTVSGVDHTSVPPRRSAMQFSLMPYYHHATNSKNATHQKVPLGDRLGRINMLGVLINDTAGPHANRFTADNDDTALHTAFKSIKDANSDATSPYLGADYVAVDGDETAISGNPEDYHFGRYRTALDQWRRGIRANFEYSFANGFGVAIKGGVAEYAITPAYVGNPEWNSSFSKWKDGGETAADGTVLKAINDTLTNQTSRTAIGTQLGVDFTGAKDSTTLEDTHLEVYWRKGYVMRDAEGDKVLTAIPYFSVGITVPTAEKKTKNNLFDIAIGNDGFYGFTGLAEVSFDFPGMIKAGFGGSVTVFNEDAIGSQFAPTSEHQQTLFPWQATVTKRPGALWKVYGTVKAHNFIDYLSCYMSYVIVSRDKSDNTFTGANKAEFKKEQYDEIDKFGAQLMHLGFDYEVTPSLRFGLGMQSVFAGFRVWKAVTVFGSASFVF